MKMNGMSKVATACCSLLIVAGGMPVLAQSDASKASMADKKFVTEALQGGMAEVQLGQLATQKGSSDDVKKFGQKMVEDHTKMGDEMKGVASQIGVFDPGKVTAKDKALMDRLQGLSGDAFDKAYIQAMVKDHKMDLMEFKKEAASGMAAPVKEEASKGSEVISQHLQMIEQIAQAHHVMAGSASSM
jgi:putative membrane protein